MTIAEKTKPDTLLKRDIKYYLQSHIGRENTLPRRNLLMRLRLPQSQDRKMRRAISELRHEGTPILFATEKPTGYYLPANLSELQAGIKKMRSYVIDECWTIRDLKVYGAQFVAGESQGRLV